MRYDKGMFDKTDRPVRLLSFAEDQPQSAHGSLIPRRVARKRTVTTATRSSSTIVRSVGMAVVPVIGVIALLLVGTAGYGLVAQNNYAAAPTVTIVNPYTNVATQLTYGEQPALARTVFFTETRDAFIDTETTFIEVDLSANTIRFFNKGILLFSGEVLVTPEEKSWADVPSGLYQITQKHETLFSSFAQVDLPWHMAFEGNFAIHGWPYYPDGTVVGSDFTEGGIRLSTEDAEKLFQMIRTGTPVLIHEEPEAEETFTYEPSVAFMETPHYLVADVKNGTIIASSDMNTAAPIASVTKLMTAVVVAEEIPLEERVPVASPMFVTSLVPRLSERSSVSMYSLLQLLLVESSNEAAEVIAGVLGRDLFIAKMNDKAAELGMKETVFADPSGLSADNVSSLADLFSLTRYIYSSRPFIFEVTAEKDKAGAYTADEFGSLLNFNRIEDVENFIGGKVGETAAAGQTSVSLHRVKIQGEERVLVVILMGSENRVADVKTLLEYASARFERE